MSGIEDLPTPCILIDDHRLEANLAAMSSRLSNVDLRPHIKTHKSILLAKRQLDHGAHGITVAKVSEAETFVQHGFKDVRIAYPVIGNYQLHKVASLAQKARISFCIDTFEGAQHASSILRHAPHPVNVLMEVDTGFGRCGIPYDHHDLLKLASTIQQLDGLNLCGILTHEGQAYTCDNLSRREVMIQTRDRMLNVAVNIHEVLNLDPASFEISIGSTPSITEFENRTNVGFQITEVRPGNYIFHDLTQVELGVCSLSECALTVLSTVVSHHRTSQGTERFILDAGRKVLSSDQLQGSSEYGCILYNPRTRVAHPHARITGVSEEHGWGTVQGGSTFHVGDRLQIIPNHACVVVNMMDHMFLVDGDGDKVLSKVSVDARGCVV